jgi:ATP-dependent DNA helicase RecG
MCPYLNQGAGMTNIHTLEDIATLSETIGLECKLAAGRDGKGQLPADFWLTFSALANQEDAA